MSVDQKDSADSRLLQDNCGGLIYHRQVCELSALGKREGESVEVLRY